MTCPADIGHFHGVLRRVRCAMDFSPGGGPVKKSYPICPTEKSEAVVVVLPTFLVFVGCNDIGNRR